MIGDTEPEDEYDAGDPIRLRLAILVAIVEAVRDDPDDERRERRRLDALRVLGAFRDELTATDSHLGALRAQLEEIG